MQSSALQKKVSYKKLWIWNKFLEPQEESTHMVNRTHLESSSGLEMSQELGALTALQRNQVQLMTSTHMMAHNSL